MTDLTKLFEKYCNVMKESTKGNEIGVYSVAFIGLGFALRRIRPFSKFKKPSDVPNYFIQKRKELTGVVERIEPNGALLMINHKPLVSVPGFSKDCLPVKLVNVKVSGFGISWLQAIVAGNEVKLIPVSKSTNYVSCQVVLPQLKKKIDVGESLVSIGFGTVEPAMNENVQKHYIKKLQAAERIALRKQMGLLYYLKPTKLVLKILLRAFKNFIEQNIMNWQLKKKAIPSVK